jgi:hypothetical protein
MACIRDLTTGFSLREPGFIQSATHVGFVVDKVALEQVFFWVFQLFSIIPPMLNPHLSMCHYATEV